MPMGYLLALLFLIGVSFIVPSVGRAWFLLAAIVIAGGFYFQGRKGKAK